MLPHAMRSGGHYVFVMSRCLSRAYIAGRVSPLHTRSMQRRHHMTRARGLKLSNSV